MGKTSVGHRELPLHSVMVRNILSVAVGQDIACGQWYITNNAKICELSIDSGLSLEAVCGIVAALSPQSAWERNLAEAILFAHNGIFGNYMQSGINLLKADRCRNGENPLHVLRGNKVLSFYDNLLRPMQSGAVTIDRHAMKVALYGRVNLAVNRPPTDKAYHAIADAYRNAAKLVGLRPLELQALTWAHYNAK